MRDKNVPVTINPESILITGGDGQLAAACSKQWPHAKLFLRDELDITDSDEVFDKVLQNNPDLIINCAAYTNVEGAETDPDTALRVNALGPLFLAKAATKCGAILVHVSTDYVFDGQQSSYVEHDSISPINMYGISKAAGEQAVTAYASRHYIVRTSALYGPRRHDQGENFVTKRLSQLRSGSPIHMVNDQETVPTYTIDLADCFHQLIAKQLPFGTYHAVNSGGGVTWYEFARAIAVATGYESSIMPTCSSDSNSIVNRPTHSVLDDTKLKSYGITMPSWQNALRRYIDYIT